MAPSSISSRLGCVAAVMAIESPSQPRPAVIQRMSTAGTAGRSRIVIPANSACSRFPTLPYLGSEAGSPLRQRERSSERCTINKLDVNGKATFQFRRGRITR